MPRLLVASLTVVALLTRAAARCPDYSKLKNAYFGDLHTHTSYSLDAFEFGTRTDPTQAYAFATGTAVDVARGYDPSAGQVPGPFGITIDVSGGRLDFGAVTDHSEWLATDYGCTIDTTSPFYGSAYCTALRALQAPPPNEQSCRGFADQTGSGCQAAQTTAWQAERQATEAANDPCRFTSFHGYEWTFVQASSRPPLPAVLHKNVIFRDDNVPPVPLDSINYPTGPILWAALADQCNERNGCAVLTIPHNMNQSAGLAFNLNGYSATDLNRMMKFQRLAEIHQSKGNSECVTDPADTGAAVACDFETGREFAPGDAPGYARPGLEQGIARFAARGYDPLKFGFVGSTDTHDATMGNVGQQAWPGVFGAADNTPARRLQFGPLTMNPGGITGIWAEQNTRDALWAALERRETFATSGARIRVRFYEYTGLRDPCGDPRFPARIVKRGGVPMGGTMAYNGAPPSFVAYALQDQMPLASVDLVKASLANGHGEEKIAALPFTGPPYCVTWTDPAFDPKEPAFYYARVKEQPTWRWSHYDCERLRESNPDDWQAVAPGCASNDPSNGGLDVMVQQRAWTSSIWYLPGGPVTVRTTILDIRDGPAERRFVFRSRTGADSSDHRVVVPRPGSIGDPTASGIVGGGTLTVVNPDSGERFTATLPASGWRLRGRRYTFDDPGGPIRRVSVGSDLLSVSGGGGAFGYALGQNPQGAIAVRLQLGTAEPWCAEAPAKDAGRPANDSVERFRAQAGTPPPEQCPALDPVAPRERVG